MSYPITKGAVYLLISLICSSCGLSSLTHLKLNLGDSEVVTRKKMADAGGSDITNRTGCDFTRQWTGKQKHYLWELPDKTTVLLSFHAPKGGSMRLIEAEATFAGAGIEGIVHWDEWRDRGVMRELCRDGSFKPYTAVGK